MSEVRTDEQLDETAKPKDAITPVPEKSDPFLQTGEVEALSATLPLSAPTSENIPTAPGVIGTDLDSNKAIMQEIEQGNITDEMDIRKIVYNVKYKFSSPAVREATVLTMLRLFRSGAFHEGKPPLSPAAIAETKSVRRFLRVALGNDTLFEPHAGAGESPSDNDSATTSSRKPPDSLKLLSAAIENGTLEGAVAFDDPDDKTEKNAK